MLYQNIQGLKNKVSILESFLSQNTKVHVICLSEHWLAKNEISLSFPYNFYCASAYTRSNHIRGGSCIFLNSKYSSREFNISNFCEEFNFEACAVFIDDLKLIVVCLYHSTAGDPYIFLNILEQFLLFICQWSCYNIVIGGDFNINFDVTKGTVSSVKHFLNIMKEHSFYYLNNMPTRGKNCLDNIFIKNVSFSSNPKISIFKFPYSDHDGIVAKV